MVVSFCGDITGDCMATLFFAEVPVGLPEGVLMVGSGFGILPGVSRWKDSLVVGVVGCFLIVVGLGYGVGEDVMLSVVCASGRREGEADADALGEKG